MKNLNKKEKQAAQGAINQETIVDRIYPVRWNVLNRRALVQPNFETTSSSPHRQRGNVNALPHWQTSIEQTYRTTIKTMLGIIRSLTGKVRQA